jgi:EamA domain-containing membrane protein RarD
LRRGAPPLALSTLGFLQYLSPTPVPAHEILVYGEGFDRAHAVPLLI